MRNKVVVSIAVGVAIVLWVARRFWLTWLFLSRGVQWFVRHLPKLRLPTRGVRKTLAWDAWGLLKPGDILISESPLGLSALFTPGWDHAALCVAGAKHLDGRQIAEMTIDGFDVVTWEAFCGHSRRVLICRCEDWDAEYCRSVIEVCMSMKGLEYDTAFEMNNVRLTCAELVTESDFKKRLKFTPGVAIGIGRPFVAPQHILDAANVTIVWDSRGKLFGKTKR
jgi:hypothetical protein